jgi:putative phosphoesterase
MKVALLGDIHGNASALAAALQGAVREQASLLLLTGDFVGYYYHPEHVLRALAGWDFQAVRGNHEDLMFAAQTDASAAETYRARYGSGIDVALAALSETELDYLRDLPVTREVQLEGRRLLLGHGAPWDTDFYIYPDAAEEVWGRLASLGYDYIVLGHTHHRYSRRVGSTLVINPGSVGQPRDRQPGAAWALLDTDTDTVRFFTEPYSVEAVAVEAHQRDPSLPYLAEVLTRK